MSVDILGTKCDQCLSIVQCCFTSTEAIRLVRTAQDGHLDFHTELWRLLLLMLFTSTETVRLVRTGSPGRPPRLSHSS